MIQTEPAEPTARVERDMADEEYVVIRLSEANKQKLLRETVHAFESRDAESEAVLRRLHDLNPAMARDFGRKDPLLSKAPLRLLFKRSAPLYEDVAKSCSNLLVVSYCWHNESWSPVNRSQHSPWPFCKGMVDSIVELCESEDEGVFVDQPCINQNDDEEKTILVAAMNFIYRSARRMVILLEDVQLSEEEEAVATDIRNIMFEQHRMDMQLAPEQRENLATCFLKIASARWFTRAWCAHEIKVTANWQDISWQNQHTFRVYGPRGTVVKLPIFLVAWCTQSVSDLIQDRTLAPLNDVQAQREVYWRFMSLLDFSPVHQLDKPSTELSVMTQYARMSPLSCLIQADKIGVTLNVCGLGLFYKGSVQTEDGCFWIFTVLALAIGEVAVLVLGGTLLRMQREGAMVHTWARRTRVAWIANELRVPIKASAISIHATEIDRLELDLLLFSAKVQYPSDDNLQTAWSLVKSLTSAELESLRATSEKPLPEGFEFDKAALSPEDVPLSNSMVAHGVPQSMQDHLHYVQCTVAFCLQMGSISQLQSLLNAIEEALKQERNNEDFYFSRVSKDVHPLARLLYAKLQNGRPQEKARTAAAELSIVHRLLSIATNEHFRGIVPFLGPMIQTHEHPTRYALTKSCPLAHKHVIAVPVCLADNAYSLLNRAWVLERTDGSGHWPVSNPHQWRLRKELTASRPAADATLSDLTRRLFTSPTNPGAGIEEEGLAWRIVDKAPFCGCPPLAPDGKMVRLLRRQRVYGRDFWWRKTLAEEEDID